MAERNNKPAGKGRDKRSKGVVIDVGEQPAEKDSESDDEDADAEDSGRQQAPDVDPDLDEAAAAAVIDVDDPVEEGEDAPVPAVSRGSGSLARRDPMAVYMREVRRAKSTHTQPHPGCPHDHRCL